AVASVGEPGAKPCATMPSALPCTSSNTQLNALPAASMTLPVRQHEPAPLERIGRFYASWLRRVEAAPVRPRNRLAPPVQLAASPAMSQRFGQ
ncbi:MAG: hypothetical protein ACJ8HJ_29140, partial [Massilia sp.]